MKERFLEKYSFLRKKIFENSKLKSDKLKCATQNHRLFPGGLVTSDGNRTSKIRGPKIENHKSIILKSIRFKSEIRNLGD